jgi:nucleoside-diphosphate kinase
LNSLQGTSVISNVEAAGSSSSTAKIPLEGIPGTNAERTFIAIKPDGVQRALVGQIIQRFEDKGFTLVAMKLIVPSSAQAAGHYDDLKTKPFFPGLIKFFSSGPVVAMVWQGKGVIKTGRVMLGATNPAESAPGTIRGDFAVEVGRNICHGSDSSEAAQKEIKFWFKAEEAADWSKDANKWIYEKDA